MTAPALDALARVVAALPGGGEARTGQVTMVEAVAGAIAAERHLVVQAGTGTGKGIGYLVPAILSGSVTVVATATKALQDQLATKDLPFLRQHLDVPFDYAVLKGRSNYLCRQRADEVGGAATADGGSQLLLDNDGDTDAAQLGALGKEVKRLLEWSRETTTGDRADLDFEPRAAAWAQVSVSAMDCPGAVKCPAGDRCFAEAARQRAAEANVVVVNTHLYGTHLASGGFVLPEHDVVVFDEAHELEDVASSSLGLELTAGRFTNLARTLRAVTDAATVADDLVRAGDRIELAAAGWLGKRLPAGLGDARTSIEAAANVAREAYRALNAAKDTSDEPRRQRGLRAVGHLVGDLDYLLALDETSVAWVEGRAHAPVLKCAPIDVGQQLAEKLWGNVTAILTSATIPLAVKERLGIEPDGCDQLDVGSPFDYEEQALLYCAAHLPDPRKPEFEAAAQAELKALIEAAGGRTLALFTSWRAMTNAAEALDGEVPYRILTQSELPKPALVRAFADDESSCLFATMGFWQGVDVPGSACSQVVIDKLPFPRPDEPLLQARRDRAGPAAFRLIDLPRAATLLAQGAGRLIRSTSDRGVVAVLDNRLATAGYRWDLVRALPPMRRTKERQVVEDFWAVNRGVAAGSGSSE